MIDMNRSFDFSRLDKDEFEFVERLLAKAAGEHDEKCVPPFRIEFIAPIGEEAANDGN